MERRTFIKLSSLSLMAFAMDSCFKSSDQRKYKTHIHTDVKKGHKVFGKGKIPTGVTYNHDFLIVGGGIAGLASAYAAKDQDFILCEISDRWGGSSGAVEIENKMYCQGAHYDLAYPDYYGKDTLQILEDLDIIKFEKHGKIWNFVDSEHLIQNFNESRCYQDGDFREDLFEQNDQTRDFYILIEKFIGQMKMPTREVNENLHYLDKISFKAFLTDKVELDEDFYRILDYQLIDDYGGGSEEISAFAGIHYYTCRPYRKQSVELFPPPEGNYYFVNKFTENLPSERLKLNQGIFKITELNDRFEVDVFNANTGKMDTIICKKIVYAGQKHALKYIYPQDANLFKNDYAPWLVVNVHITEPLGRENTYWQNEIINDNIKLLGFVNSQSQSKDKKNQVFTFYFCFSPEERKMLLEIDKHTQPIANECVDLLEEIFDTDLQDKVEGIYFKPMGHAMPIPRPDYLFADKKRKYSNKNIRYAGVDTGRLPLFFEAVDSGVLAVKELS